MAPRPCAWSSYPLGAERALRRQGITEVMWESDEPKFTQYPLNEFLDRFPAGSYRVVGRTLAGDLIEGETELTHDIPAEPDITSHEDGDEVELDGENVTITWDEIPADFLLPDREYKLEVGAIEESGNRTLQELSFETVNKIP